MAIFVILFLCSKALRYKSRLIYLLVYLSLLHVYHVRQFCRTLLIKVLFICGILVKYACTHILCSLC